MHYLEDDIDLLDGIPEEVKRQCYEIRELDSQAEKTHVDVRNESRSFFNSLHSMSPSEKSRRYQKIKETYRLLREMNAEKLAITEFLELMLEKYQERIAKDLNEFKVELELDTPGITRSIETDLCATLKHVNPHRRSFNKSAGVGGDMTGVTTDDSGFEDQKYSASYGRTKHHGLGIS